MRAWPLLIAIWACSKEAAAPKLASRGGMAAPETTPGTAPETTPETTTHAARVELPAHRAYPDLETALVATIPADARVIGFGELHSRTDRRPVTSSLAHVTQALPAIAGQLSDLILETWLVDPACGKAAAQATTKVETAMKRPEGTKSEIAQLASAARAAHIQPHAMTLTCSDYAAITPAQGEVDPAAILTLTTGELARVATSAVRHRNQAPGRRPWIAIYGGALHNDRFPDPSVAEWSYAAEVDRVTSGHFVEIDVIVPELAEADPVLERQPWFPLARAARDPANPVLVWTRGERSFVVVLPPT